MASDQQRLNTTDRENLVAFLDGELTDAQSQQISAKLAQSVSARKEVDLLKRTWELMDFLPRPTAPEGFSSRTLTHATGQATLDDKLATAAGRTFSRVGRLMILAACVAAAFVAAHAVVRWAWPDPTSRLARELTLAEYFEAYQAVDSFELLKQLDEAIPEFSEGGASRAGAVAEGVR